MAQVNGETITAEEVAAVASDEAIADPQRALDRVITLHLLAEEARRERLDRDPLVEDMRRRAMVQSLLVHDVEAAVPPEPLPAADLAAGMRIRGFELAHGELWRVQHALVQVPPTATAAQRDELRAKAEEIRQRMEAIPSASRADRLLSTMRAVCGRTPCREENLPGFDRDGRYGQGEMAAPFAAAATTLMEPGDLSPVVETQFGYHVIVLVERLPALNRPAGEVEAIVRQELLWHLRHRQLERLLDTLRTRYGTVIRDNVLRAAERIAIAGETP